MTRRLGSMAAFTVAVVALLLLWLRPGSDARDIREARLLTPGFERLEVDLADRELKTYRIAERSQISPSASSGDVEFTADLDALTRDHAEITRLKVFGYGLPVWEWSRFSGTIEFFPAELPAGIVRISWPRRLHLGEDLLIEGSFHRPEGRRLRLDGPGGRIESFEFPPEVRNEADDATRAAFAFRTRPKEVGRFFYRLSWDDDGGEQTRQMDVEVIEASPPTVLWLENAPSFETRAFKRRHVEQGGKIAVRSRVGRERFRWETGGYDASSAPRRVSFDAQSLGRFDLIVADVETLRGERLLEHISKDVGAPEDVGLLLRISADDLSSAEDHGLIELLDERAIALERAADDLEEWAVEPRWPGAEPLPALAVAPWQLVARDPRIAKLVVDDAGRALAVRADRFGVHLLHDTFRWGLEGEDDAFDRYWARLVRVLARGDARTRWDLPQGPLFVDEPIDLRAPGGAAEIEIVDPRGEPLRAAASEGIVRWLPREAGTHRLLAEAAAGDVVSARIDVRNADDWPVFRAARNVDATRKAALRRMPDHESTRGETEAARLVFFRRFLWFLAVAALFALWTIERLPQR